MSYSDFAKIAEIKTVKKSKLSAYLDTLEKLNIHITLYKAKV